VALEIPMIARGEILGLLQIYADGEDAERRLEEVSGIGTALADAMSLALANIALRDKLRSQALRDPLTGLYNRRYMEDTLQRVVRLADRERHDVSVIMIDLDHFKRLNDQHGHAKGDTVLRDAAAVVINQMRETDVACRYGGEELIVVMPNCGLEAAAAKAERIRVGIEALSENGGVQVSASFGVAAIPATSLAAKDLVANADAALYRAKQEGRNRVVRAILRENGERPDGLAEPEFSRYPELLAAE
jgi:diguanylate cyclase (GGDEF)-like protein